MTNDIIISANFFKDFDKLDNELQKRLPKFIKDLSKCTSMNSQVAKGLNLEKLVGKHELYSARYTDGYRVVYTIIKSVFCLIIIDNHDNAYNRAKRCKINESRTILIPVIDLDNDIVKNSENQNRDNFHSLFRSLDKKDLVALELPNYILEFILRPDTNLDDINNYAKFDDLINRKQKRIIQLLIDGYEPKIISDIIKDFDTNELVDVDKGYQVVKSSESESNNNAWFDEMHTDWIIYITNEQLEYAIKPYNKAMLITGTAGTGKTIIGIHRANFLARKGLNVLITAYNNKITDDIKNRINVLCKTEELKKIKVLKFYSVVKEVLSKKYSKMTYLSDVKSYVKFVYPIIQQLAGSYDAKSLNDDWSEIIAKYGITSADEYLAYIPLDRKDIFTQNDRIDIWNTIFKKVLAELTKIHRFTFEHAVKKARVIADSLADKDKYDAIIVDELQDLGKADLSLLSKLLKSDSNMLTLIGDKRQQIYRKGIVFKDIGINIVGRSYVLRKCFRTSAQIMRFAESINVNSSNEFDSYISLIKNYIVESIHNGPNPVTKMFQDRLELFSYIKQILLNPYNKHHLAEVGVLFRDTNLNQEFNKFIKTDLTSEEDTKYLKDFKGKTLKTIKGLEFKVVIVIDSSADFLNNADNDYNENLTIERNLLYVGFTRARDELHVLRLPGSSAFEDVYTRYESQSAQK